jgi:hypothetical protein
VNYLSILGALMGAYLTGATGPIRAGKYAVSATLASGTPVHLTLGAVLTAAAKVAAGQVGTVQSGDISITVSTWPA